MKKDNSSITPINEELNVVTYETENIKDLIYTIRGKQVMLDSDVAMLYHYPTKRINETVRRNKERFPKSFCFQLTDIETENLRSQFATSSLEKQNYGGRRTLPYVFTEQGIAMLSGLLKNDIAIQVSINIMNAFVEMRKFIINNAFVFQEINSMKTKLLEHDKKFDAVFDELYHCGASLKDLGKKCFAISKIEDMEYVEKMSNNL